MRKMVIERAEFIGLEKGIDYEIVTVTVWDRDYNLFPFGRFFRKNVMDLVKRERWGRSIEEIAHEESKPMDNVFFVQETRPLNDVHQVYRLQENMIDIDTAIDCGFGIIRVLHEKYKGEYFLYNSENAEEEIPLMLDVYMQIAVNHYDNKSLEKIIWTKSGRELIKLLQHTDDNALLHKLEMAFLNKKGGDNVINLNTAFRE